MSARRDKPDFSGVQRVLRGAGLALLACVTLLPGAALAEAGWQVQVVDVDPAGLAQAASEVNVELVTLTAGSDAQPAKQVSVLSVKTDAAGGLRLAPPKQGQLLQLRFREGGALVNAPVTATGQIIGRYSAKLAKDDVELRVRSNLEVRDSGLRVWSLYTFQTDRPGVMRWRNETAIALPLLAPIVGDVVLDRGAIPNAARHMDVVVDGDATVERRDGALMLVGAVAPGRPISVRVRYPIGSAAATVALGLRGVVGKTHLAVAVIGVRPSRPRVVAAVPARGGRNDAGRDRMAGLAILQPVKSGEIARVWVTDLPVIAAWPRRVLGGAALLLSLFALAAVLRRRG